jgi:beta-glucosidase
MASANRHTVVVLETGNPILMPWQKSVAAIVEAWFPGQKGGQAIANVLTGEVNPSGRLPITFPASLAQPPNPNLPGADIAPSQAAKDSSGMAPDERPPFSLRYPEGADVGYRWYDRHSLKPLYPFGHGLS